MEKRDRKKYLLRPLTDALSSSLSSTLLSLLPITGESLCSAALKMYWSLMNHCSVHTHPCTWNLLYLRAIRKCFCTNKGEVSVLYRSPYAHKNWDKGTKCMNPHFFAKVNIPELTEGEFPSVALPHVNSRSIKNTTIDKAL